MIRYRPIVSACLALFALLPLVGLADHPVDSAAVVRVSAGNSVGTGTFFFTDTAGDYYALTNEHVGGRKGARVGVDIWSEGKLIDRAPGVVVASRNDGGGVDVAVVRVAKAALKVIPPVIPLADPGSTVGPDEEIASRGCPGGTWQTHFVGRTFKSDQTRMQFYPRPGGGRSGSAIVRDGKIVGLLTWSSGKPSSESHGTDGFGYRSGFGIAQQIDIVWRVLRGQVSEVASDPLPPEFVPLRYTLSMSMGTPKCQWLGLIQNPEDPEASDFQLTPEDQESMLRRMRERQGDGGSAGGGGLLTPSTPRQPLANMASIFRSLVILVIVLAVVWLIYTWRHPRSVMLLFVAIVVAGSPALAQDPVRQPELQELVDQWNTEQVSSVERWGSYESAFNAAKPLGKTKQRAIVTIVTIPNCPACEKLKAQLVEADQYGWLNDSETAIVDATAQPSLAAALCQGIPSDAQYPRLVLQVPVETESGVSILKAVRVGCFPATESSQAAMGIEPAETLADKPLPETAERFLAAYGVR